MPRGNFSNFGNTTLAGGAGGGGTTMLAGDLSFTVSAGTGNSFPVISTAPGNYHPDNFIVAIDQELILISARSGDSFTVAGGGRGWEGTTAASHIVGAPVVSTVTAGILSRIWLASPDTYEPDVPPWARNGPAPSQWDDEFETTAGSVGTNGNWTFTPNDGGQNHTWNTDWPSFFDFQRANNSNSIYFLYQPFAPGNIPFTITAKVSHRASLTSAGNAEMNFFVSDSANPSTAPDGGNRARVDSIYEPCTLTGIQLTNSSGVSTVKVQIVQGSYDKAGAWSRMQSIDNSGVSWTLGSGLLYYSLSYDGSNYWQAFIGDGYTYHHLGHVLMPFTPASFGFRWYSTTASGNYTEEQCLIDWVRVVTNRNRAVFADQKFLN